MNGFIPLRPLAVLLFVSICRGALAPQPAEDGQWIMPAKNPQGWRFSGLDLINTTNAKHLKVAWTFSTRR